jgi:hypothetical protein
VRETLHERDVKTAVSDNEPSLPATNNTVAIDFQRIARTFEGLGALESYGKLLYDYPQKQREEILDYLYKPNYGASLQILKVEIGSDTNNTATAWPSHQRSLEEKPNFERGFVWWLIDEARKRNPDLILAALNWGYPAWCSTDELKAQFIYDFVRGARAEHRTDIQYIGGNQNESAITPEVTKILRKKLNEGGLGNVKIIAADEGGAGFKVLNYMDRDKDYKDAIDVIGTHFKSGTQVPAKALEMGKSLWSSEDGGGGYTSISGYSWVSQMMRLLNDNHFSAIVRWLVTASAYPNMPWPTNGMMKTNEPWSGNYLVATNLWAFAHFTQFTKPGWDIVETKDNDIYSDGNGKKAGKYMAFLDPKSGDYTIVVETDSGNFPKEGLEVQFKLEGVGDKPLQVWRSDFNQRESEWFIHSGTVTPQNGNFQMKLDNNCVYTISSTTGQGKGETKPPAAKHFELPYSDNFESYKAGAMPKYFVDADGIFEIADATGREGKVLQQAIHDSPIHWHPNSGHPRQPVTEIGDIAWSDYKVHTDVLLENEGTALLGGRIDGKQEGTGAYLLEGYWLSLSSEGKWKLFRLKTPDYPSGKNNEMLAYTSKYVLSPDLVVTLAEGSISGFGTNQWANFALKFEGNRIKAYMNDTMVADVTDSTYARGNVALSTFGIGVQNFFAHSETYGNAQFDNFAVVKPVD